MEAVLLMDVERVLRTLATCRSQRGQRQDGRCAAARSRGRAGRRAHSGCGVAWCRARAALQRRRARASAWSQASCSAFGSTTGQHTCRATPTAAAAFQHMPESDSATRCAPTHGRARDCPRGAALAAPLLRLLRCATAASRLTGLSPTPRLHLSPTPLACLSRCVARGAARRQVHDAYMHTLADACEREAARARQAGEPARFAAMQGEGSIRCIGGIRKGTVEELISAVAAAAHVAEEAERQRAAAAAAERQRAAEEAQFQQAAAAAAQPSKRKRVAFSLTVVSNAEKDEAVVRGGARKVPRHNSSFCPQRQVQQQRCSRRLEAGAVKAQVGATPGAGTGPRSAVGSSGAPHASHPPHLSPLTHMTPLPCHLWQSRRDERGPRTSTRATRRRAAAAARRSPRRRRARGR